MDRSNFANVLITTRLLPYFNFDNVATIKSCILEELGCQDDKEFLCKILTMIYGSLSNKSTTIIKNKAIEIADSQPLTSSSSSSCSNRKGTTHSNDGGELLAPGKASAKSIYKYVEEKYNDLLSNLNGNVVDHIGSFLTKQESISFGYLNKQLYIETQKLSYLLRRCKDTDDKNPFTLNADSASKLLWPVSSAYSYSFPMHLSVGHNSQFYNRYSWNKILKQDFFNNFFSRLNCLQCTSLEMIGYIPILVYFLTVNVISMAVNIFKNLVFQDHLVIKISTGKKLKQVLINFVKNWMNIKN